MFSVKFISEIDQKSAKIQDKTNMHISRLRANCQTANMYTLNTLIKVAYFLHENRTASYIRIICSLSSITFQY